MHDKIEGFDAYILGTTGASLHKGEKAILHRFIPFENDEDPIDSFRKELALHSAPALSSAERKVLLLYLVYAKKKTAAWCLQADRQPSL